MLSCIGECMFFLFSFLNRRFLCIFLAAAFMSIAIPAKVSGRDAAQVLIETYPDAGMTLEEDASGRYIRAGDTRFLFSPASGCPSVTPGQAGDPPLCALFAQPYPTGAGGRHPEPGFDPGRIRNEAFLKMLYGENSGMVEQETAVIELAGEKLAISKRHGAAEAMSRVAARLEELMSESPETREYILPTAGSYFWRTIQGSGKLSAHSFGIAVDLNVEKGLYWKWAKRGSKQVERVRLEYPQAIVDIFEAEGFIWGGKWDSFDFMHFEYRPELLK